jgi:Nucleoside 2-deoxyribosyltransferase
MKIYLAGPLFTTAERNFNNELTSLLRDKGYEVWLPQEFEHMTMTPKQIFVKDVEGIDWADVVVANMDGSDPDAGTCWECGYAYRKKAGDSVSNRLSRRLQNPWRFCERGGRRRTLRSHADRIRHETPQPAICDCRQRRRQH